MAALTIPDDRFEKPALFYPQRKPIGRMRVRRSHPLAPDEACVILGGEVYDALFGKPLAPADKTKVTPIKEDGTEAVQFTNTSANSSYLLAKPITHHVAGDLWTISWRGRNDPSDTNATTFCGLDNGANSDYMQMRKNNAFRLRRGVSHTSGTMPAYSDMDWYSLCFTANGYDIYKNGVYQAQYVGSNIPASIGLDTIGCAFNNPTYGCAGALGEFYVHSFSLTASQIRSLHMYPYQFMAPE